MHISPHNNHDGLPLLGFRLSTLHHKLDCKQVATRKPCYCRETTWCRRKLQSI